VWNHHDPDAKDTFVTRLDAVVKPFLDAGSPIYRAFERWEESFDRTETFRRGAVRSFPHEHTLEPADLSASYATSSDVASLPRDRREALLRAVDELAVTLDRPVLTHMVAFVHLFEAV
jgi:hypothetical protein